MLSSILSNQKASDFFKQNSTGGTPVTPAPSDVPGVKQGLPPVTQQQQQQQPPITKQGGEDTIDLKAELAKFEAKPDNDANGNPITGEPNKPAEYTLPDGEAFQDYAKTISSNLTINEDLAKAALGGDMGAFQQVLSDMMTQTIGLTMQNASAASLQMYRKLSEQNTETVVASVTDKQTHTAIVKEAEKLDPSVTSDPMRNKMFDMAASELRKKYPTAPNELIAKSVLDSMGFKPSADTSKGKQPDEEYNWLAHTR